MSVRKEITTYDGIFFITFTCCRWLHLFEEAKAHDIVYKWFDYLKSKKHYILGYVIMPNHVHVLIAFRNTQGQSINAIVGNGKRFMTYEIVKRLKELKRNDILENLSSNVAEREKTKGKLHEVFEPSFDWKECTTDKFILQKLNYIHENPCRGSWNLVTQLEDYVHGSAGYYSSGKQSAYEVTNYMELEDIDLTKAWMD